MALIDSLASAIAQFEGFFKLGSRAARNNNPGNLTAGPRAISKDAAGYAVYATVEDGWADLRRQIELDIGRGFDLTGFLTKYAPPAENPTAAYIAFVAAKVGIPVDVPLATLAQQAAVVTESPPVSPTLGPGLSPSRRPAPRKG